MLSSMEAAERFGPTEQTPAQRQAVLHEVEALKATQGLLPFGQRHYQHCVASELRLAECSAQLRQHYSRV
jgi:hypothetical protein